MVIHAFSQALGRQRLWGLNLRPCSCYTYSLQISYKPRHTHFIFLLKFIFEDRVLKEPSLD